jgi:transposase
MQPRRCHAGGYGELIMSHAPCSCQPDLFDSPNPALLPAWLGCDVAKGTFDAAVYPPVPAGAPPRPLESLCAATFPRTAQGVAQCLQWAQGQLDAFARAERLEAAPPLRVVMEATGRYSIELIAWFVEHCPTAARPSLLDPTVSHHFLKSLRLRNKTDRIEARAIARLGAERVPASHQPRPAHYESLRELSRERDTIVQIHVSVRNRAQELTDYPEVAKIHQRLVRDVQKALEKVEQAIVAHVQKHDDLNGIVTRLQTIPGVGFWTATVVLAELGDLARFARARQITAYAGVSPRRYQSGTSVRGGTHLCKQGSARVRQALFLSGMSASRGDNDLGRFYRHLVEDVGKPKMVALGAVMRKQLVLMRSLVIHEETYQDHRGDPRPIPTTAQTDKTPQATKKTPRPCGKPVKKNRGKEAFST